MLELSVAVVEPAAAHHAPFAIEADGLGRGGVAADEVVPPTADNLRRTWLHGEDLPLQAAVRWLTGASRSTQQRARAA